MANEELNQVELEQLEQEYNELIRQRLQKLDELKQKGQDPFEIVKYDRTHSSKDVRDNFEQLEGTKVKVAGRLMSKRVHGKAGFSDIHDRYGRLQIYIKIDEAPNGVYSNDTKKLEAIANEICNRISMIVRENNSCYSFIKYC
jgi:lysyl-tRNA synthetase class 2